MSRARPCRVTKLENTTTSLIQATMNLPSHCREAPTLRKIQPGLQAENSTTVDALKLHTMVEARPREGVSRLCVARITSLQFVLQHVQQLDASFPKVARYVLFRFQQHARLRIFPRCPDAPSFPARLSSRLRVLTEQVKRVERTFNSFIIRFRCPMLNPNSL